jgi:putative DNA-invertase from lambdoid prophage Rac
MPRTFAYCRVSTLGHTVENQIREIEAAGFGVEKRRTTTETVSGSSAIEQRRGFMKLLDRLEHDDVLVVTKLDRLGRNSIDVQTTVNKLAERGVRVHCLALGGVDLTSPAGKMTMGVIAAVAQFEKDLLIERTQAGQARAKAEGKKFGRPAVLTDEGRAKALQRLADGVSISAVAREMKASRATIMRVGRVGGRLQPDRGSTIARAPI